jgi:hypothetical protein
MKRVVFLCGLLFSFVPFNTFAQDEETIEKVQGHFERGAAAFENKDYETAIREFEAGNGLMPDPIFLYNISLAHGLLGRVEQSLAVARLAEATGLDEPDATQNRARIVALTRATQANELSRTMSTIVQAPETTPLLSWYGWAGVGTAGLGLLSLTAATILDISIGPDIENYKEAAAIGDAITYRRLKSDIESDQAAAKTLFFSGLGLTAIGAALITYDVLVRSKSADSSLSLSLTPNGAMTTFQFQW